MTEERPLLDGGGELCDAMTQRSKTTSRWSGRAVRICLMVLYISYRTDG